MEIPVDVRHPSEIPDQFRTLDLPGVPDFVVADVEGATVAGDEEALDHLCILNRLHGRGDVVRPEAREHAAHGVEQLGLLVLAEVRAAEAREVSLLFLDDAGGVLIARFHADESLLLLLAVEGAVELIEEQPLIPEGIALVILRLAEGLGEVTVENRFGIEAHAFVRVRVATARDVMPGVDELEVLVLGRAEEADRRRVFDLAHEVMVHLPVHLLAILRRMERLEDLLHKVLLLLGVESVQALVRADIPPIAHELALRMVRC